MATKSEKAPNKATKTVKAVASKTAPKSKKAVGKEDELEDDEDVLKAKSSKPVASKGRSDDDDDEGDELDDDWEKTEEEEEWDPDFDEFDLPASKTKKAPSKKGGEEDDFKFEDDEFKDPFDDKDFDDEDDF